MRDDLSGEAHGGGAAVRVARRRRGDREPRLDHGFHEHRQERRRHPLRAGTRLRKGIVAEAPFGSLGTSQDTRGVSCRSERPLPGTRFGSRCRDQVFRSRTSPRSPPDRARPLDGRRHEPSTTTLCETGLDLFPGALVVRMRFEVGEASVEEGALRGRNRDVRVSESVPELPDERESVPGTQFPRFLQQVRPHDQSIRADNGPGRRPKVTLKDGPHGGIGGVDRAYPYSVTRRPGIQECTIDPPPLHQAVCQRWASLRAMRRKTIPTPTSTATCGQTDQAGSSRQKIF